MMCDMKEIASTVHLRLVALNQEIATEQRNLSSMIREKKDYIDIKFLKNRIDSMIEEKRLIENCYSYYENLDCYTF